MSLRGRLLIAVVVLLVAGLVIADAATYFALRSFLVSQVDQRLQEAAETVEHSTVNGQSGVERGGPGGGRGRGGPSSLEQLRSASPDLFAGTVTGGQVSWTISGRRDDERGAPPALPASLPSPPGVRESSTALPGTSFEVGSTTGGGPTYRVRVSTSDLTGGSIVTALPLDQINETLQRLVAIEAIVTLIVVAACALLGSWLVRIGLRPLADIGDTAAEIAAGDLTRRVSRADSRSEVGRLGSSLNAMLGQIETAFAERQASEQALRESEARLRRFVADASHELRTPLAAVQAYAELFDRGADQHPEDLPRLMQNIYKESARMAVLVDDLLLLTRLDQGRPLDRSPVDLAAIAADAVEAAQVVDPSRPMSLDTPDSIEVRGDRVRLRQIVDNLLTNARIHTPADAAVEVRVRDLDGRAELSVVDHGPGLDPAERAQVFERFYRADPSRARADGGTGLGLSIVAAIAEAHHGVTSVTATPGGGATFSVLLPLLDGDQDGADSGETPLAHDGIEAPDSSARVTP